MKTIQIKLRNEIFANFATSLYKHRGIVMNKVAIRTTISLLANTESGSIPVSLIITFVTVSPTTMLYETMAKKNNNVAKMIISFLLYLPMNG